MLTFCTVREGHSFGAPNSKCLNMTFAPKHRRSACFLRNFVGERFLEKIAFKRNLVWKTPFSGKHFSRTQIIFLTLCATNSNQPTPKDNERFFMLFVDFSPSPQFHPPKIIEFKDESATNKNFIKIENHFQINYFIFLDAPQDCHFYHCK